jgi:hypothetical protein
MTAGQALRDDDSSLSLTLALLSLMLPRYFGSALPSAFLEVGITKLLLSDT